MTMKTQDLLEIAGEIRSHVVRLKEQGASKEELRENVVGSMNFTSETSFKMIAEEVTQSPDAALVFVHSVNQSLGGVNVVLLEEGLSPMSIHELTFIKELFIDSLEDFSGYTIEELFAQLDDHYEQNGRELN